MIPILYVAFSTLTLEKSKFDTNDIKVTVITVNCQVYIYTCLLVVKKRIM